MARSRFGGIRRRRKKRKLVTQVIKTTSSLALEEPVKIENFSYTEAKGIWTMRSVSQFPKSNLQTADVEKGLTLTRTVSSGSKDERNYMGFDSVFVTTLIFPRVPTDGLIWESGATGRGIWIGIRDSGTTLRLRAGDGGISVSGSNANTAVIDYTGFPKDGQSHVLAFDFDRIIPGTIRMFIDGVLVATGTTTGADAFETGEYSGSDQGSYLTTAAIVTVGESTSPCNLTDTGSGLRVYESQLITNYINN